MYRIVLADDERLELNAITLFLSKNFGETVELMTAASGRAAIELAESFHPDIMIMDIHMPGINGLDAIREIQEKHPGSNIRFIMLTAYDTFEYAQESVGLGVAAYLTKPVHRQELLGVVREEMKKIDEERKKRSFDLLLREKIDASRPMLEAGLIYSILLRQDWEQTMSGYIQLLEIEENAGFFMVMEFQPEADVEKKLNLTRQQGKIAALLKEVYHTSITQQMGNRVLAICFETAHQNEYTGRLSAIERAAELQQKLEKLCGREVRIGIGSTFELPRLEESYQQAIAALERSLETESNGIYHINDLPLTMGWEEGYPQELEKNLFHAAEEGNLTQVIKSAGDFFDWMQTYHSKELSDIKMKVIEHILHVEYIVFHHGGRTYYFTEHHGYLETIYEMKDLYQIREWYLEHIRSAMMLVEHAKEEQTLSHIDTVKRHIQLHYSENLTLSDMAELVHISPYYFSKLFKKGTGSTFIEYLTTIRMEEAKRQLRETGNSVKEICLNTGYSDPNYFSRSFKKYEGVTPLEYRESQRG